MFCIWIPVGHSRSNIVIFEAVYNAVFAFVAATKMFSDRVSVFEQIRMRNAHHRICYVMYDIYTKHRVKPSHTESH